MIYFLCVVFALIICSLFYLCLSLKIVGSNEAIVVKKIKTGEVKDIKGGWHFLPLFIYKTLCVISLEPRCIRCSIGFSDNKYKETLHRTCKLMFYFHVSEPLQYFNNHTIIDAKLEEIFLNHIIKNHYSNNEKIDELNADLRTKMIGIVIDNVCVFDMIELDI